MTASYANPTYQTPTRLNQLPTALSVNSGDLLLISQNGVSKQATASQVASGGLVPSGVTAGTYGTVSQVGQFTVNAQGLLTSASNIAIAIAASQVTSGQLALARGGTGADLSATGGANQVVRQSSVGGAFTVSVLANGDIPTALTGKTYNGLTITSTTGTLTIPNGATLALSGAFSTTLTATAGTNVTLPTTGTLATLAGVEALSNKTITASAFNGTIGATTPSTAVVTTLTASGQTSLGGAAGAESLRAVVVANQVNRLEVRGAATGGGPSLTAAGSDPNIPLQLTSAGTSSQFFVTGGGTQLRINDTASANRNVTITGSNGGQPSIGTSGGGLAFAPAGTVSASVVSGGLVSVPNTAIPAGGTAGVGIQMSSTSQFGIFFGSGAPTLSAAKGSLYLRSDGSGINDRMYINTNGSTTWTAVVTVA